MAILGAPQKLIVVLVLIVAVLALVVGIFVGHGLTVIPLNTSTTTWNYYGWTGVGTNPGDQLLDAQQYGTNWAVTGASEKVVIAGGIVAGNSLACVQGGQVQVWTSPDGAVWTQVTGSPFPVNVGSAVVPGGGMIPFTPVIWTQTGPFSGGLKVDLQVHILDVGLPFTGCSVGLDKGFLTVAEDEAYLIAGIGHVSADPQVQVGGTDHATVSVGYLASKTGSPGWMLYAFSTAANRVVLGPVYSNTTAWNQLQQTFSYVVQPSDFSSTAGTCGNGNRIEWHLFNELWPKDEAWTTTIDVSSLSPTFHFGSWSGTPVSGGVLNVTFSAAPNGVSKLPLSKVVIGYGFGATNHYLNLSGNATSAQIPLGSNGVLRLNGYAIDSGCRPSPVDTLSISVFAPGQEPPGAGPPNWWVFFGILLVFGAVGAVVAYYMKGPLWTRILLLALLLLVGLVIAIFAQPSVLQPNLYAVLPGVARWR